jgi:hypothetical protein
MKSTKRIKTHEILCKGKAYILTNNKLTMGQLSKSKTR